MQGTQAYTGREPRGDVRICEKETREMMDVLSCSLPSLCRNMRRLQNEASSSNNGLEGALVSAYKHLGHSKGSAQMSTWLTAIALLIVEPGCAETPVPEVSTKTSTGN
jgi:hypothetical protein